MAIELRSMETTKNHAATTTGNFAEITGPLESHRGVEDGEKSATHRSKDEQLLARFGKKQQLTRRFKYLSSTAFNMSIMLTWEVVLLSIQFGLTNGGPAGLIYGFLAAWFGSLMQALVVAELASMIPLAGGAFNWVAILSPPSCRKFLSYLTGWLTVIAWQVFMADVVYISASVLQGLIISLYPDYSPQLWHATLMFYCILAVALFMNTYLGRLLPRIESLCMIFYMIGFFGVIIPLVYLAPERRSTADVFGTWQNLGGWNTLSLSFFVGWVSSTSAFIGLDGADHIAEEIDNAAAVIPRSIWFSVVLNGGFGLGIMLVFLYVCPDYVAATESPTGFPFIDVFISNLGNDAATGLIVVICAVNILSANTLLATASRSLWAFSRENGLPFSKFLVKVNPKTRLPINANLVSIGINVILALISVGSSQAYEAFFSVSLAAYYSSFFIAACVMLYKRLTTNASELPWGPFRLGKFGVPITILAIVYTLISVAFSFFPVTTPVTAVTMNYSSLLFGSAMIFCLAFWFAYGRRTYVGPLWEFDGEFQGLNWDRSS